MASFNRVILMGNLTRDVQLKFTASQMAVADFGIAMNEKFKTQAGEERENVTFVDCTAWGKTAEFVNQYFEKGKPIFIEGKLTYETWEDKDTGAKRHKLKVTVDRVQFCGGNRNNDDGDDQGGNEQPRQQQQRTASRPAARGTSQRPQPAEQPETQFDEADIPF